MAAPGAVEQRLTRVLAIWGAGSVLVGGALVARPASRGLGRQTAAWGAVDLAIAGVGARRRAVRGPTDPERLRRVLLVNAGLDVGYLTAGAALLRSARAPSCWCWTRRRPGPCAPDPAAGPWCSETWCCGAG